MSTTTSYIFAASLLILLGLGLVFLPDKDNHKEVLPDELLEELQNEKRFISVDKLTAKMVGQDPTLLLIDVRDADSFEKFALPGAINIPFSELLAEDYEGYFDRPELELVFYSNDDLLAERAWMIKKRQQVHNLRILKGGLNEWTKNVLLATPPPPSAPSEAFDRYTFLLGARKYFVGASGPLVKAAE